MPAPKCPDCNTVMGIIQVSIDRKGYEYRTYRCNNCGYEDAVYPIDSYTTTRKRKAKRNR